MKMLIPVLFLILGLGGGVGAGLMLSPSVKDEAAGKDKVAASKEETSQNVDALEKDTGKSGDREYLKMTKQFVIPVVNSDRIAALVTMSLSLETQPGKKEKIYAIEPKLRDGFLQVLFDHANTGGFDGNFTESDNLGILRRSLLDVARKDLGDAVSQVLIMSVSRQDT